MEALVIKILGSHNVNNNKNLLKNHKKHKMNIKEIRQFLKGNKEAIACISDISNIFQSVAALVTIVGIIFIGLEYHGQQQSNRQGKAFELYQQFNSGNFLENRDELEEAFYRVNRINYQEIADYKDAMETIWKDQYVKIIRITKFFEQVATCVEKKLCDKKATIALFGTEAEEFLESHYPFFCDERKENGNKKLGTNLENFVKVVEENVVEENKEGAITNRKCTTEEKTENHMAKSN